MLSAPSSSAGAVSGVWWGIGTRPTRRTRGLRSSAPETLHSTRSGRVPSLRTQAWNAILALRAVSRFSSSDPAGEAGNTRVKEFSNQRAAGPAGTKLTSLASAAAGSIKNGSESSVNVLLAILIPDLLGGGPHDI